MLRSRSMSVHFEERSGVVPCKTPWGSWYQTMEEVFIEVNVPHGTSAKQVNCHLGSRDIELRVRGEEIFKVSSWSSHGGVYRVPNNFNEEGTVNKDVGSDLIRFCSDFVTLFCFPFEWRFIWPVNSPADRIYQWKSRPVREKRIGVVSNALQRHWHC